MHLLTPFPPLFLPSISLLSPSLLPSPLSLFFGPVLRLLTSPGAGPQVRYPKAHIWSCELSKYPLAEFHVFSAVLLLRGSKMRLGVLWWLCWAAEGGLPRVTPGQHWRRERDWLY